MADSVRQKSLENNFFEDFRNVIQEGDGPETVETRFVFFRLSRTRNIQEHMIRIYLVVVNCELIDRAGLNNPQL